MVEPLVEPALRVCYVSNTLATSPPVEVTVAPAPPRRRSTTNADPGRYPAPYPRSGWTTQTVYAIPVFAEITEATLRALPALLNPGQDGCDDTADIISGGVTDVEDLFESPIVTKILHIGQIIRVSYGEPTLLYEIGAW